MSISDLFDSGFRARNKDHFAAIVRVAMSDDVITEDEKTDIFFTPGGGQLLQ